MTDKYLNPWDERNRLKLSQMAERKIERAKNPPRQHVITDSAKKRLPPGQELTSKFPILDLGTQPNLSKSEWSLRCDGLLEYPTAWDWESFQQLPRSTLVSDIHCVTNWSRYDNEWHGVTTQDLVEIVKPLPEAKYVLIRSFDGYTTNLPIKDFLAEGAIIADHWEGKPLNREHGGPVRLVIPHLYFWKSAKWIRQIIFRKDEHKGFWEVRGYHNYGDPWKNQRFG